MQVRFNVLMAEKNLHVGRKITFRTLMEEIEPSMNTINRLVNNKVQRVSFSTLVVLCKYFRCAVGDLLEYAEPQEVKS
jgi:putative transcriptional regulator